MKKSELFTQEMFETFTCHPYAVAPIRYGEGVYLSDVYGSYSDAKKHAARGIRGYLFNLLKENGSAIWFTETDFKAECKYPDTGHCNA